MKNLSLKYLFNRRYIKHVLIKSGIIYFLCYCILLAKFGEGNFPIYLFFALIVASFNRYFYGYVSYYFNQKHVDKTTLPLGLLYLGKVLKWIGYCIWIYYFVLFMLCLNPLTVNSNFSAVIHANKFLIMIWLLILSLLVLLLMYFYKKYKMFPLMTYGVLILLNFFAVVFSITINNYIDIDNENPNIELQVIVDTGNKM